MKIKKTLKINGMHCHSCELVIKDALFELAGIIDLEFKANLLKIEFDDTKTDLNEIIEKIKLEGYDIENI
ncbi:MAG TPA: heavy-metal-associated domain-containing protein [Candidatus Nanoarchaeia archaeon]|nr:heavy-metal-associated domain-containing protein [Candidatus Nanoarchaeia archaeon]